ncbi:MAG TPA: hypothetical protein VIH72_01565 [Candidatus Acidoferrales bacterium]
MHSASFAEWIIAGFTTKARAASIIGDLLEAVPEKGRLWFWLSVARVFFSLTWRRPLAYVAAMGIVLCWVRAFRFTVFGRPSSFAVLTQQWMQQYLHVLVANSLLSVAFVYTAIVYGPEDPFVRRIAIVWILFEGLIFFGTTPGVALACVLLASCAIVYSLGSATGRRGLLAIGITAVLSFAWTKLANPFLAMTFVGFHAGWMVFLTHAGPYLSPFSRMILQLVELFTLTLIYSGIHRLFFEKNSRSSDNEAPDRAQVSVDIS